MDTKADAKVAQIARVFEVTGACIQKSMQRFGVNEQDANIPDAPARALPLPVRSDERPFDLSSDLSSLPDLIRDGDYTTTFEASVDDMMDDTTVASSIADAVKSYRGG
jgi:hypothetical protein